MMIYAIICRYQFSVKDRICTLHIPDFLEFDGILMQNDQQFIEICWKYSCFPCCAYHEPIITMYHHLHTID